MKYFLVFTPDRGDREDCSVYYSNLIIADSIEDAKAKFINHSYKLRKSQRENYLNRKLTKDEILKILNNPVTFVSRYNNDADYDIIEVNPII